MGDRRPHAAGGPWCGARTGVRPSPSALLALGVRLAYLWTMRARAAPERLGCSTTRSPPTSPRDGGSSTSSRSSTSTRRRSARRSSPRCSDSSTGSRGAPRGSPGVSRWRSACCSSSCCHRVVLRHVDRRTALAAAVLVACYPPLVANDIVPLTESLSLLVIVLLADRICRANWVWAGVLCGLLILTRPSAQGLVVVVGIALWVVVGPKRAAAALGIAVLVVVPWVVRNAVQVGTLEHRHVQRVQHRRPLLARRPRSSGRSSTPCTTPASTTCGCCSSTRPRGTTSYGGGGLANIQRNPGQVWAVVGRNSERVLRARPVAQREPRAHRRSEHDDPHVDAAALPRGHGRRPRRASGWGAATASCS